ncbi:MAG: hypothetical protein ABI621_19550 [Chloroflexota bacterium]
MKNFFITLKSTALISFIIMLPFMIMEFINRRNFHEGFPIPLFVIPWLLPVIFSISFMPIVRNVRAGNSLLASPVSFLFRVVILVISAWMWTGILIDQLPCFPGVLNCD